MTRKRLLTTHLVGKKAASGLCLWLLLHIG